MPFKRQSAYWVLDASRPESLKTAAGWINAALMPRRQPETTHQHWERSPQPPWS